MYQPLLMLIVFAHVLYVMFIILTPFIGNNYFMILHAIVVPFMMLHWYINDNTCVLTLIEKQIRCKLYGSYPDPNDCITYKLIAPVYDFNKNHVDQTHAIYAITTILWIISCCRLYANHRNGKLSKLEDIVKF